ncbi:MAG: M3 family oligoendopeptidase [Clostridiales bacterium]|nr:M3 family oligoendopeptidase [Clostridiales bacterium]
MEMPQYAELTYERPSVEEFRECAMRTRLRLMTSKDIALVESSLAELQKLLSKFYTAESMCRIRHDQDTTDSFYADEMTFFEEADPIVGELTSAVYSSLLNSEIVPLLMQRFGKMIFMKAKTFKETISTEVVEELSQEAALQNRYDQILSEAEIEFAGHTYNLSMMNPFLESTNREERKNAAKSVSDYYAGELKQFNGIFGEMVKIRTSIAQKLSYPTFVELGYKRMERYDYTPEMVEELRQNILRYIVPITVEIRRLQKKRLEVDELLYYDLPCLFSKGNPRPAIEMKDYTRCAGELFRALFEKDPSFFDVLREHGFTDLETREKKSTGGYCSTLQDYGIPFIFMNANGTFDDISTLVHESGHAYAAIRGVDSSPFIECQSPTLETCEIHSTALEYLSYPYLEVFFKGNASAFREMHMTDALLFLPYGCMVDEFQHRVYREPDLSASQRHSVWKALEDKYQPFLKYDGNEFYESGAAWVKKSHIFTAPFYYIDYCIAQIVALQLWDISRKNPQEALLKYDRICSEGGNKPFLEIIEAADLQSPFSADVVKRIAYITSEYLGL